MHIKRIIIIINNRQVYWTEAETGLKNKHGPMVIGGGWRWLVRIHAIPG